MLKFVYNTLSIVASFALLGFIGYCIYQYNLYGMSQVFLYIAMSIVSIAVLLGSLNFGGKKNEEKH